MNLTVKPISNSHAEIWAGGKWVATVSLDGDKDRADVVRLAIENAASAKRNEIQQETR